MKADRRVIIAVVSVLAVTPIWTVEAKVEVASKKVEIDNYKKMANQLKEKITPMFPKVKE
ncbi:hypothetical protein [Brevibacillus laterosporus]|uniref:hypothetical protein n=1 Tax=Brevibacillus laterosporus TaxID=1465 RepID=UPI0003686EE9|nr:hypothetical protein [Brevibacillus laterosporus]ATO51540.1 hypothetical protein BrL25_22060 [Brevibacillus laterosporus DSM 25]AYB38126.1 hypothetical protein D5F52_07430 [Brevibacillus laterosporus]MBG9805057.1 hypothetical protein [Brevibacillus laterosporus]MBM7110293.1 hypothetical protein [Brevibacillus laterosporus]MED2004433.1 hypothetical protein [Brevibacillus laterosporus]